MAIDTAYLHPTAILTLSNLINIPTKSDLYGLLLGKISENSVSLLHAHYIPEESITEKSVIEENIRLLSNIYGNGYLTVIGIFQMSTTDVKNIEKCNEINDLLVNLKTKVDNITDTKISLLKDTPNINNFILLGIHRNDLLSSSNNIQDIFQITQFENPTHYIPIEIRLIEGERLSLSLYDKATKNKDNATKQVIKERLNKLKNLEKRLTNAKLFSSKVNSNEIDISNDPDAKELYAKSIEMIENLETMKQKLLNQSSNDEIDVSIALTSTCASLLRQNFEIFINQ